MTMRKLTKRKKMHLTAKVKVMSVVKNQVVKVMTTMIILVASEGIGAEISDVEQFREVAEIGLAGIGTDLNLKIMKILRFTLPNFLPKRLRRTSKNFSRSTAKLLIFKSKPVMLLSNTTPLKMPQKPLRK